MTREELLSLPKIERQAEMSRWGLNVNPVKFIRKGDEQALRVLAEEVLDPREWEDNTEPYSSARTYADAEDQHMGTAPLFTRQPAGPLFQKLLEVVHHYNIMFSTKPITPEDTLLCGNVHLQLHSHDGYGIAQFFVCEGPGTVRDIEHRGVHIECNLHGNAYWEGRIIPELAQVKFDLMNKCPFFNDLIFEWSLYPYGIGDRNQELIWWEVRRSR